MSEEDALTILQANAANRSLGNRYCSADIRLRHPPLMDGLRTIKSA